MEEEKKDIVYGKKADDIPELKGSYFLAFQSLVLAGLVFLFGVVLCGVYRVVLVISLILMALLVLFALMQVITRIRSKKALKACTPPWHPDEDLFDRFAVQLNNLSHVGLEPQMVQQDVFYLLDLMDERLKKLRLTREIEITRHTDNSFYESTYDAGPYKAHRVTKSITRELVYEGVYKEFHPAITSEDQMSVLFIDHENQEDIGDMVYYCPNCGGATRVRDLIAGCPYCMTRYVMDDIFPVAVNYSFTEAPSNDTLNKKAWTYLPGWMLGFTVLSLILYVKETPGVYFIHFIVPSLIYGFLMGLFFSFATSYIKGTFASAKGGPVKFGKEGKFNKYMTTIDPDYSPTIFNAKVLNLTRMAVFASDTGRMAFWKAGARDKRFKYIVDMVPKDYLYVTDFSHDAKTITVTCRVFSKDCVYVKNHLEEHCDKIDITLKRDIEIQRDPLFTMHLVKCPNCGGSFDAMHESTCPFCDTVYDTEVHDWVITNLAFVEE